MSGAPGKAGGCPGHREPAGGAPGTAGVGLSAHSGAQALSPAMCRHLSHPRQSAGTGRAWLCPHRLVIEEVSEVIGPCSSDSAGTVWPRYLTSLVPTHRAGEPSLNLCWRKRSDPGAPTESRESSASPRDPLLCPDNLSLAIRLGPGGQRAARRQPRLERAAGPGPLAPHRCLGSAFLATHSSTSFSTAFLLWSFGRWVLTTTSATRPHLSPKRHYKEQLPPLGQPSPPWSLSHRPSPKALPKAHRAPPECSCGLSCSQGCKRHLRTALPGHRLCTAQLGPWEGGPGPRAGSEPALLVNTR